MDCSFCRYTFYVGISDGSLERARQTTVGAILADLHASVAM